MRFHPAPWLLIAAGLLLVCSSLILAASTPPAVSDLRIARSGIAARLSWLHNDSTIVRYEVWRSDDRPYAAPGDAGSRRVATATPGALNATMGVTDADAGTGDPKRSSFYTVRGVNVGGTPAAPSNRGVKSTCR